MGKRTVIQCRRRNQAGGSPRPNNPQFMQIANTLSIILQLKTSFAWHKTKQMVTKDYIQKGEKCNPNI